MPGEMDTDGPFGEFTGFLDHQSPCNIFHLTAITHRTESDLPRRTRRLPLRRGLIYILGMEPVVLQKLRDVEGVLDVHMPLSGVGFELIISMRVTSRVRFAKPSSGSWVMPTSAGTSSTSPWSAMASTSGTATTSHGLWQRMCRRTVMC